MLTLLLIACNGNQIGEARGIKMSEYFPQDGERAAVWVNEDAAVEWRLRAEKLPEPTIMNDVEVWTWEYFSRTDEDLEKLYSVQWAAPAGDGVQIYGYGAGEEDITPFDPPIVVAPISDFLDTGEKIETQTGGTTWTVELTEVLATCEVQWGTLTWQSCAHITINDGEENDASDAGFAGEYWQVTQYGTAWFKPSGEENMWILLDYEWTES